jgi:esterase/lipase
MIQGYRWGSGSKNILLLHGWQSHTYRWKAYVDAINKEDYTVYAIDAPGHGLSSGGFMTVPLYSETIQKAIQHIGKVHQVLAHSIGSFTAIYTFYKHPELTPDKLMVMASPGEANDFFQFYEKTLGLSSKSLDYTIRHFEKVIGLPPAYFSVSRFAKVVNTTALIIHDEEDNETSVENSKVIHRSMSSSRLVVTKGKGHNLKSLEVVREVISFMEETDIGISSPNFKLQSN